ncbi:MAG: 8-oxo-dGTP diphosphatase [Alkalispirochaeta sp.]
MSFDWSDYHPHDRAVLCFLRERSRKQILLIEKKRGLGAGKINAPGGKLEKNETTLEAAIRETTEEVGLVPDKLIGHGVLRFAFTDGYNLEVSIFSGTDWSGTMIETDEAVPFWVNENEIPFEQMWEDDAHWLPYILDGHNVNAEMVFSGDKMVQWNIRFSHGVRLSGQSTLSHHRARTKHKSLS